LKANKMKLSGATTTDSQQRDHSFIRKETLWYRAAM
jgi:hypothetical protein